MTPLLPIIHQSGGFVAIDKPSGLSVHRGLSHDAVFVVTLLREQLGAAVFPVHRLDRATSGVLLLAKDAASAREAQSAFVEGGAQKRYLALVRGVPAAPSGLIDAPVPKGEGEERVPARTGYRTLAVVEVPGADRSGAARRFAVVEARPETGRFHQIRRHLKHIGHPLVGDTNYGDGRVNRFFREHVGITRLGLHASALDLELPGSGQRLHLTAPLPGDLAAPLVRLGLDLSLLA